jgi:hypothetical protein
MSYEVSQWSAVLSSQLRFAKENEELAIYNNSAAVHLNDSAIYVSASLTISSFNRAQSGAAHAE